ncbi:phosphonate ABC transporter, permease protein PhnE [Paenibacillus solisilvae]|uniref:Phosphonate ABC transporter, permease protein PhnE n=1 Tax=Paenibacillus solisilvae TaxID=2486751 RepID=A0ABW0W9P7_9BACL
MLDAQQRKLVVEDMKPRWFDLRKQWKFWIILFSLSLVYVWSGKGTGISLPALIEGIPHMKDFLSRALPPDLSILGRLIAPTIETIQIALIGTTLAVILSILLGIGAARNMSPHPVIYSICRMILNFLRATSELIFALIFVSAVGLGPFPGVLAIGLHSAGMLGKFYAEAIENVSKGEIEALQAAGANKWQVLRFAVWPQILPDFVTVNLYRWEYNIRSATVLGLVGAGGIGFELMTTMRLFRYEETATVILIILVTVTLIDSISTRIRRKVM